MIRILSILILLLTALPANAASDEDLLRVEGALFNLRREAQAVRLFEFGHLFPAAVPEVDAQGIILGGAGWELCNALDLIAGM